MTTEAETADHAATYDSLSAPFEHTFKDTRGGVELEYITGEQCISRLNETIGVANWSFTIREHGLNSEADEFWVLGQLVATIDGQSVAREQFGSQKLHRARASGNPLDIGFDLKGATTDCLKKCSMSIGIGLYLSHKEPQQPRERENGTTHARATNPVPKPSQAPPPARDDQDEWFCEDCGEALSETKFRDGTSWTPTVLANYGRRKHNRALCMNHYRAANESRPRAEQSMEETPF